MKISDTGKVFSAIVLLSISSLSLAAGDPPQTLNSQQAQSAFASYKSILMLGCPGAQNITAGTVHGGDSPMGGSQTTTFNFDGGATVTVLNSWGAANGGSRSPNTITITCSLGN